MRRAGYATSLAPLDGDLLLVGLEDRDNLVEDTAANGNAAGEEGVLVMGGGILEKGGGLFMSNEIMIRIFLFSLLCLWDPLIAAPAAVPGPDAEAAAQVAAARAILDSWHATSPNPGDRKLHLVYWTPSDREPAAQHGERLKRIMENIRKFYADEMERLGFGPRTFNLDYEQDGALRIHLVRGAGPFADYNVQSGRQVRKECLPVLRKAGIDADRETILIFCNLAVWDAENLVFRHQSPYYAGGSHRQGTAWQLDSPELDTRNLSKTEPMMHDGQYGRISLGKHNSIFIGGIAHELGHALSLPHNAARPDEAVRGTALMGSGNRTYANELRNEGKGSFLTLAHGLRLASHPQFSGSVKGMNDPARAVFSDLMARPDGKSFHFSGKVSSEIPVYAIVAYCDPAGRGDYDSTTATAIPDKDGNFSLHCRALAPGKSAELRIVACLANGASSAKSGPKLSFPYSVNREGIADVSAIQQRFVLTPLIDALVNRSGPAAVDSALAKLKQDAPGEQAERLANRLIASQRNQAAQHSPDKVPASIASIPLADTRPGSAKVGWGRPVFNFVPDNTLLLDAGGILFEHGIYAHAPAEHVYQLAGKWKRLQGNCGVASGHHGSVSFAIVGDGKNLWNSKVAKDGTVHRYDIDLTGVKVLQLLVKDGGDGPGNDWGLWLEPVLTR